MTESLIAKKVQEFFSRFSSHTYKKGQALLSPGDQKSQIYYLQSGHVRQYILTPEGQEVTVNIYKPGTFFPMALMSPSYSHAYTFVAIDDVAVYIAPYKEVEQFIKANSDILFDLLGRVYSGLEGILSQFAHHVSGSARKRLMTALVIVAKRFGKSKEQEIHVSLKQTHQDLASLTGLTRETVSRQMAQLQEEGFIVYAHSSIVVKDISALEKELV
jgi:CRP/FNR family cyclic AMP-dependent transcriptional regulator